MALALIVAAGSGERLGAGRAKAFVELAHRPLLQWSLDALAAVAGIERIVVALPGPAVTGLPAGLKAPPGTLAVAGGPTRSASVRLALDAAGPGGPILIHDAARPLLSAGLAERVLAAVGRDGVAGAIAATPVTDTIKRAAAAASLGEGSERRRAGDRDAGSSEGAELAVVTETLERSSLWAVQTPQVFRREALERALDVPREVLAGATDDAWLVERTGGRIVVVPSPPENLKVTTPLDLAVAELLIERGGAGHG
jgi:2-C-methyl-D-erythritol 4-phosphate cytidylyltransferase